MRMREVLMLMLVVLAYVALLGAGRARVVVGPDLAFAECEVAVGSSAQDAGDAPKGMACVVRHVPSTMVALSRGGGTLVDPDDGFVVRRSVFMSDAVPRRKRFVPRVEDGEQYADASRDLWLLGGADGAEQKPSGWGWLADSIRGGRNGRDTSFLDRRRDVLDTRVLRQDVFTRARNGEPRVRARDSFPMRRTGSGYEPPTWAQEGHPPGEYYP